MDEKPQIRRRDILKTACAISGISTVGATVSSGVSGVSSDTIQLVDVGVEHAVDFPNINGQFHRPVIDEFVSHVVNDEKRYVRLPSHTPDELYALFQRENGVLRYRGYHPKAPVTVGGKTKQIITELGQAYRAKQGLLLAEEYALPKILVAPNDDDVVVKISDSRTQVSPTEEKTISVPTPTEIKAQAFRPTDEKVEGNGEMAEWKKALKTERWEETVEITPKVKVHNHGKLKVVKG